MCRFIDSKVSWAFAVLKFLATALWCLSALAAEPWPLERLFTRPFAWGTSPEKPRWSKQGHTLLFLWNAQGGRFLDLYAYHPDQQKLVRLTDLEPLRDPLNRTAAEKDQRQKRYLMPPEGLSDFDVSRDGSQAAFAYHGDLFLVRTSGAEPPFRLTRTKAAESAPQLAPGRDRLAFTRDGQLFVQDLKRGQLWQVTDIEGEGQSLAGYRWAPDGQRFYYTTRVGSGRRIPLPNYSGRVVTAAPFPRTLAGDPAPESRLYVVLADGRAPLAMEAGPWGGKVYGAEPLWSPDSTRILQRVIHPNLKKEQLIVLDARTGKPSVVFEDSDAAWIEPMFAAWSPDARDILFTSERDGWSHLYKIPAAGGEPRQLTRGAWEIHSERSFPSEPQWIDDSIYYSSTEAGTSERQFYRIRSDGSGKEQLSSGEGLHLGQVSEDGKYTAMMSADLRNPLDLYVNGHRVTTSPRPEFRDYPWPEMRFVSFPSLADHKTIAAKMFLPPGYRQGQGKYPAVFFVHGSGYATSVLKQWGAYHDLRHVFNCYLANKGYVVLDMDYRGSSGYGRDWRTGVYLHMGGKDLEDVLSGVDYLRGSGNIDINRLGVWGSSYGGFMTDMVMFLSPDTFRAGAAFSAVNDWENYNAFYTEQRLTKPQENPEAYRRSSPVHFSGMLKNHLLMVHGIVDNNVMFQDAVQLSEKLIQGGKHFEEIYYPEESHLFVRDETLIDAFRRAAEFLDRYLK